MTAGLQFFHDPAPRRTVRALLRDALHRDPKAVPFPEIPRQPASRVPQCGTRPSAPRQGRAAVTAD